MYRRLRSDHTEDRSVKYLVEVFTPAESWPGEWLAISSRINTWLFSLFRQTKQSSWNPNRPASPKFNLVFACGYIAKRQHRRTALAADSTAPRANLRGSHLKAGHRHVCVYTRSLIPHARPQSRPSADR